MKLSVAAIIPAHNEEKTVGEIVTALEKTELLSEIIVVDDGSTDRTADLAKRAGAQVISLSKNIGKGGAMATGVAATTAPVILFFDADLSGVTREHVAALLNPVLNGEAEMVSGIRPELKEMYDFSEEIPVLSGQRALKREIFEAVPADMREGYQIEEALNYYCKANNQRVKLVVLEGLNHLRKIPKSNFLVGAWGYLKMSWQITKVFFKVRLTHLFRDIF